MRRGGGLLLADDVRALRRREREQVGRKRGIAPHVGERELRGLAERIGQQHLARQVVDEADPDAGELRLG